MVEGTYNLLGRLRQENHSNLGGRGCSELRLYYCTPAWATQQDPSLKINSKAIQCLQSLLIFLKHPEFLKLRQFALERLSHLLCLVFLTAQVALSPWFALGLVTATVSSASLMLTVPLLQYLLLCLKLSFWDYFPSLDSFCFSNGPLLRCVYGKPCWFFFIWK